MMVNIKAEESSDITSVPTARGAFSMTAIQVCHSFPSARNLTAGCTFVGVDDGCL